MTHTTGKSIFPNQFVPTPLIVRQSSKHDRLILLVNAGISPRVAMELMRHSDMRLTAKTYTDVMNLPLFGELEKLTPALPSLPASLNCEKTGLKEDNSDQTELQKKIADCVLNDDRRTGLTELVPSLEKFELAERGGFEPPTALGCSRFPGVRVKPLCHLSIASLALHCRRKGHGGQAHSAYMLLYFSCFLSRNPGRSVFLRGLAV